MERNDRYYFESEESQERYDNLWKENSIVMTFAGASLLVNAVLIMVVLFILLSKP